MYNLLMYEIPIEIANYFSNADFKSFPKIKIPQSYLDNRGAIINIADGNLGDVAIINSKAGAVRANHVHSSDWHLSYCLSGSLGYSFVNKSGNVETSTILTGDLFFTPSGVPHRMDFLEDCSLVVVSRNSRKSDKYDTDTAKYVVNLASEIERN